MKRTLKNIILGTCLALAPLLFSSRAYAAQEFVRGDVDGDGKITLTDSVKTLNYLFKGSEKPDCEDAADLDDNGKIDISDAVYELGYLFQGKQEPAKPFPGRGYDLTKEGLGCGGEGDLEARIIMQKDIPLTIAESGTENEPLLYILGEDLSSPKTGISMEGVHDIILYGNGKHLEYGKDVGRNLYGVEGVRVRNIRVIGMNFENRVAQGAFKFGIFFSDYAGKIDINKNEILTYSDDGDGIHLRGENVGEDAEVVIADNIVTTHGSDADALHIAAYTSRWIPSLGEIIKYNQIVTHGSSADGAHLNGGEILFRNSITIYGDAARGVDLTDSLHISLVDTNVNIRGENSYGIKMARSFDNVLDNLQINVLGKNSHGISFQGLSKDNTFSDSNIHSTLGQDVYFSQYISGETTFTNVDHDSSKVAFHPDSQAQLVSKWYLNSQVMNHDSFPLQAASVKGYRPEDADLKDPIFSASTNLKGQIEPQTIIGSISTANDIIHVPYKLVASHPDYNNPATLHLDKVEDNVNWEAILEN